MARIRTIKPEFWSDYRIAKELRREVRLFYISLWNEADDEGRFQAHPRRLLGVCFPYDDDLTPDTIAEWLSSIEATGRLIRYTVGSEPYVQLTKFAQHQKINRPSESRLPSPPLLNGEGSVNPHGALSEPSSPRARAPDLEEEEEEEVGNGSRKRIVEEERATVLKLHAGDPFEESVTRIILAANRGMLDNPAIGDSCHPIATSHGSRQFVIDWLADGVPEDVASLVVYQRAKSWTPSDRRKQISTMSYFDAAIREAGDMHRARNAALPSAAPAASTVPAVDNSKVGKWKRAHPEEYEQLESEVRADLPRYPWWEGVRDKEAEIRKHLEDKVFAMLVPMRVPAG